MINYYIQKRIMSDAYFLQANKINNIKTLIYKKG